MSRSGEDAFFFCRMNFDVRTFKYNYQVVEDWKYNCAFMSICRAVGVSSSILYRHIITSQKKQSKNITSKVRHLRQFPDRVTKMKL